MADLKIDKDTLIAAVHQAAVDAEAAVREACRALDDVPTEIESLLSAAVCVRTLDFKVPKPANGHRVVFEAGSLSVATREVRREDPNHGAYSNYQCTESRHEDSRTRYPIEPGPHRLYLIVLPASAATEGERP